MNVRPALLRSDGDGASAGAPTSRYAFFVCVELLRDRRAEERVQVVGAHAELVQVRFAGHDSAGGAQTLHDRSIVGRGEVAEEGGGAGRGRVGGADVVFDAYEAAIEGVAWGERGRVRKRSPGVVGWWLLWEVCDSACWTFWSTAAVSGRVMKALRLLRAA